MPKEFSHRMRVRFSDCDPQNVLFYANHLEYFDVAITELWREATESYDAMTEGGIDIVVAEASIRYLSPVRFDSEVDVTVGLTRLGNTAMSSHLTISADGELRSEGDLRHVFIAAGSGEKVPMPEAIRAGLEPYLLDAPDGARNA
jgi:acyl-CoA thioester hydrolase